MSKLEVDKIDPQSGTALEIGTSGDTVTIPSGVTLDASNATTSLPATVVTTTGTQTLTNKSIATTQLTGTITPSDNTVSTAKIVDANVTLAKLSATGTKDATTFLRGDNTFASAGGTNTPSFYATRTGGNQSMSDNTFTKAQINSELYDTANAYDNSSNYRFTPQTSGKYYIFSCGVLSDGGTQYENNLKIYKNGSALPEQQYNYQASGGNLSTHFIAVVCDMNGSSDYVEVYMKADSNGSTPVVANGSSFGAYKIIT